MAGCWWAKQGVVLGVVFLYFGMEICLDIMVWCHVRFLELLTGHVADQGWGWTL